VNAWQRFWTERLVNGRLPTWLARRVHAAIGRDEAWRAAYAERRAGEPGLDLVGQLVLGDPRLAPKRAPLAIGGFATAAAAAAVVLLLVLPEKEGLDLAPRSDSDAALGVRVRCHDGADERRVRGDTTLAAGEVGADMRCPRDGLLSFALTNQGEAPAYVFVLAVRDDGAPLWLAPFDRAGRALAVAPGAAGEAVPLAATLKGMELGSRATLHAVFTDRALRGDEVESLLEGARARGLDLSSLDRLPVPAARVARALVVWEGGG
jgi:hypothetical protein